MAKQVREKIAPMMGTMEGQRVFIVGSGPSLDSVGIRALKNEYVLALNGSIEVFAGRPFSDLWWVWWDIRAYRQVWPRVSMRFKHAQVITHLHGMEMMRGHKGGGRWIDLGSRDSWFKPTRSVLEVALKIADFLGFSMTVLVGVDGFKPSDSGRPYCKAVDSWKECYFMNVERPASWKKANGQLIDALGDLELKNTRVVQTSPVGRDLGFEFATLEDVLSVERPERKPRRRGFAYFG